MKAEAEKIGEDMGVCSCPACGEYYCQLGQVVECECGFKFPTDWWPQYSWGSQAGRRVADGAPISGGMKHKCQHPYYRYGFEHPVVEAWKVKDTIDWRAVMQGVEQKSMGMLGSEYAICRRCGKTKPPPRENSSQLCIECDSETSCVHYKPDSPMDRKYVCGAGIKVYSLTGTKPGCGLLTPCRYIEGGTPVKCDKFTPTPVEQLKREDEAWESRKAEFMLVGTIVSAIKTEHKGANWSGTVECPACQGKLHVSHAAYNGHVHGQCETDNCLSWME